MLLWCKLCFYWQCCQFGYLVVDVVGLWIEFFGLGDWVEYLEVWCGIGVGFGYLLLVYCVVCQIGIDQGVLELVCVMQLVCVKVFVQVIGDDYLYLVMYVVGVLQFVQFGINDWYVGVVVLLVVQLCCSWCCLREVVEMWIEVVCGCFWKVM